MSKDFCIGVVRLMEENLIKRLMTSIKCDSCGQNYEIYDVDVLGHSEDTWFLKVICSSCQVQSLVAAIVKEHQMPEVVTDLTDAELVKFADVGVVGADDVLNMHDFLKAFEGDFSRLFGRE